MQRLKDIDQSVFHYINRASMDMFYYFNRLLFQNGFNINTQEWILLSSYYRASREKSEMVPAIIF